MTKTQFVINVVSLQR